MPAARIDCTRCGARLRVPEGKAKIRCPGCGTVLRVPTGVDAREAGRRAVAPPEEEEVERLEEVDESPAPPRRRRDGRGGRPRVRHRPGASLGDYLWLIAAGIAPVFFLCSFAACMLAWGATGLPHALREGDSFDTMLGIVFTIVAGLVMYIGGVFGVKNREMQGRGFVTRGPLAVLLGFIITVLGGCFGGVGAYGLLMVLVHGR